MNIICKYQQGIQYIGKNEAYEIVETIREKGQYFPFKNGTLYRGVCHGEKHKVGDIIEVTKNVFESWSENLQVAEDFSKEKGSGVSAVYVLYTGEIKGLMLEDYSMEMEWLLTKNKYIVDEMEENEDYTMYYLILYGGD